MKKVRSPRSTTQVPRRDSVVSKRSKS
jgi:hypothetical protein